eukprot:COSAG01_NODE_334_length_18708_cov_49.649686_10_plen_90_part_00
MDALLPASRRRRACAGGGTEEASINRDGSRSCLGHMVEQARIWWLRLRLWLRLYASRQAAHGPHAMQAGPRRSCGAAVRPPVRHGMDGG